MLTVKQAAEKLQVSPERVRNMIYDGVLSAQKFGNNWAIPEQAIIDRIASRPKRGRPKKAVIKPRIEYHVIELGHHLYKECKDTFNEGVDMQMLAQAESKEEQEFYKTMWNFFLGSKQEKLVAQGIY